MLTSSTELVTGDGRIVTVGDISQLYRNGSNLSSTSAGKIQRLSENNFSLTSVSDTLDCDTQETLKTFKIYSLTTCTKPNVGRCIESVRCISGQHMFVDSATITSENGRFLARLKVPSSIGKEANESNKRQLLEIWDRSRHLRTIDMSDLEAHGFINTDNTFGSVKWCPFGEQDKLLYICQGKQPKTSNFFKQEKAGSQPVERGQEFAHRENWGESLNDVEHNVAAILDISNNFNITIIDVAGFSLGDSSWIDNGNKILSVAYQEEPRRLGIVHCNNRPSKILVHDLSQSPPEEILCLQETNKALHNPRVDNSGMRFVFLANETYGAHCHSVELHLYDLNKNQDVQLTSSKSELFVNYLPRNCFTSDDKHVLFLRKDHLYSHMCLFNLESKKLFTIKFPTTGVVIHDFQDDIILASGSEINATPTLFVAVLSSANNAELVAWHQIEEYVHLDEIEYESHLIPTQDNSSFVSALMIRPNLQLLSRLSNSKIDQSKFIDDQTQLPTVVLIHGGPHSAIIVEFRPYYVFYARLGLKTLIINYRGSTGVNEEYLQSLCGKVGQLDVEDCLFTIRHFAKNKSINTSKLIIQGGSHGGFIGCHLSCQDEFKFTSAIIRNPVVNIATMHETSDLPDWSYTEALGHTKFDFKWMPNSEDLRVMYECSPMYKVSRANVPTLMLLGTKDCRVKMFQGLRWIELLKARGLDTKCKVYPDEHNLSKPEVMADAAVSSAIWILTHLNS